MVIGFTILTALEENEDTLMVFGNDLLNAAFLPFSYAVESASSFTS